MATLEIKSGVNASPDRTFIGHWSFPETPENRVAGTLQFTPDGGTLSLYGGLTENDLGLARDTTLVGVLNDGQRITALNCMCMERNSQEGVVGDERWLCTGVLIGAWVSDVVHARFSRIGISTHQLGRWAVVAPRMSREDGVRTLTVDRPRESQCDVPGLGSVQLGWMESSIEGLSTARLDFVPRFQLVSDAPLTLDESFRKFIAPVVHLMTFATGQRDVIASITLHGLVTRTTTVPVDFHAIVSGIEWISTDWRRTDAQEAERVRAHHMIEFAEAQTRFGELVPTWFGLEARYSVPLMRFFSVWLDPVTFPEDSFDRVIRALEAWSREDSSQTYMSREDFEGLLSDIESAFPDKWTFLEMRLKNANSLTLAQRLSSLVAEAGDPLATLIGNARDFERRTVDTRNDFAHEGEAFRDFSIAALPIAQVIWQLVMIAILLGRLGFDRADVSRIVSQSPQWEFVNSAAAQRTLSS
jgi:hypothetical protein